MPSSFRFQNKETIRPHQLKDDVALDEYDIQNGTTLHSVLRLRAGMFHSTSGKADFDYLLYTNTTVIMKNIIRFNLHDGTGAHSVLTDLYYGIENIDIDMLSFDLKKDIFLRMNNQEESSDDNSHLISRIFIAGYYIDLTSTTPFWCKFRAYLTGVTTLISFTYTCLASIDQVFVTSRNATLRRFSNIKFTRRIMLIFVMIWCLYCIPHVFFYDISPTTQTCTIINTSYGIYAPVYVLSLTCTIPIGIMTICGYLTYRNIRLTRVLVNQLADYQLVRMTLIQIVLIVITIGPYGVNNVYNLLTSSIGKDSDRLLKESFASSMFSLIVYANYVGNFYMFLISSRRFRRQVKNRLLFWLRQSRIHPVMITRI
ncbi:unnamed protein product [Adineta ricciae]|uniref:G-protein coupled receptors family 1 profile domain-containing protein n=1 Tax=Adineta ricciae TaxID=249248 RepID=A0A815P2M3_ADIRI|nr:unnamed protein product [Adineta ricciae]CAF1443319.1 unnamed protein product [Adineta ricciae]